MTILSEGIKRFFSSDRAKKIIVVCGLAAMILILLSSFFGRSGSNADSQDKIYSIDYEELEKKLEDKLCGLILQIEGAGKVSVMITVDRTELILYEKNSKTNGSENDHSEETEVALSGNSKEPLEIGKIMPTIRSAAIVCEGAKDPIIRERVTNVASKALNIGISKVYVAY